eukprot:TRINITY_DN39046_c0_g1_i1.p1 TRINITY_DN39046_c0_g1~~TRINITY_DN39046_c0_g1_i1.p1  ORF type:complete len:149 (+),score=34.58 TRINITY_DN39046_c0_g1_i1:55-501(+)
MISFVFTFLLLVTSYLSFFFFFFLMIRRPPRSTLSSSSAASDVYKRQPQNCIVIQNHVCKVIDLGAAVSPGQPSLFVGTIGYTSPRRSSRVSPDDSIDIFALGMIFSEMCRGTELEMVIKPLVEQCCTAAREERPSAEQVLEALAGLI